MLKIAICDDSRTDIEMLESAFDKLCQYPIEYDVYFSGEELLTYCTLHDETYHLYIFDIEIITSCQESVGHSRKILSTQLYSWNSCLWIFRSPSSKDVS